MGPMIVKEASDSGARVAAANAIEVFQLSPDCGKIRNLAVALVGEVIFG
jgi:hypothetical protein